jgi:hypothetical protein
VLHIGILTRIQAYPRGRAYTAWSMREGAEKNAIHLEKEVCPRNIFYLNVMEKEKM